MKFDEEYFVLRLFDLSILLERSTFQKRERSGGQDNFSSRCEGIRVERIDDENVLPQFLLFSQSMIEVEVTR